MVKAVLFDLDGTLIDTAPDMGTALNNLLIEEGHAPLPLEKIRPFVSQGGLVLTRLGFADKVATDQIEALRLRYLDHYHAIVADNSRLFDGFELVLKRLESNGIIWGIVTNKPEWLTFPLLDQLELSARAAIVIGGDTLEKRKPHPMQLLVAAERLGLAGADCIYIGDDERDIVAGNAANMTTLIAAYGYIDKPNEMPSWHADGIIQTPADLLVHPLLMPYL